jgi:D-alanyl-D-alanine carboxypeptidase
VYSPARAAPYAAMVMDARTGEVLHSRNADTRLHPASLTKMMTLYIAFEAVRLGEIDLDTQVRISANAAAEPPSKLGLRAGSTIRFRFLIRAAAIRSANDAATAIAEAISGSEAAFARRMNRTARALGMTRTTFRNAHGLTEDGHMSTARDMTLLGRRMVYDYPQYYNIFSRREDNAGIAQVRNTNRHVLNAYAGADGIKTGYTRAAGFNLVASAQRGQERIIATVFGGRSAAWRNQRIMELLDMGFARAPSNARSACPVCRNTTMTGPPAGPRAPTASCRAASPLPARPWRHPKPALVAAIGEAVEDAVGEALMEPAPRPSAVAPEAVARALTEALDPVDEEPIPGPAGNRRRRARAETRSAGALMEPPPLPDPAVARGRHARLLHRLAAFGVSLGAQPSHHAAERLLLQTALAELGTFDDALRRVVQRSGGYEARFAGMTEEQARARLRKVGRAEHDLRDLRTLTPPKGVFRGKRAGRKKNARFSPSSLLGPVLVIVAEDTVGVAFGVVELPALEKPEERAQPHEAQEQADGDQDTEDVHQGSLQPQCVERDRNRRHRHRQGGDQRRGEPRDGQGTARTL